MASTLAFDYTTDWLRPDSSAACEREQLAPHLASNATAAADAVTKLFPVASEWHGTRRWLTQIAVSDLVLDFFRELAGAMIAAECFRARILGPRRTTRRKRWLDYESNRIAAARALIADVLARWTIATRIPRDWIPEEIVFREVRQLLHAADLAPVAIQGKLRPPIPGGDEWLAQRCSGDRVLLLRELQAGPCPAVVFWQGHVSAVVLCLDSSDVVAAHAPSLQSQTWRTDVLSAVEVNGIMRLAVATSPAPPAALTQRLLRVVCLSEWWWSLARKWRRRAARRAA